MALYGLINQNNPKSQIKTWLYG